MAAKRKYPVGIQSFESIRQDGYVYVDKTPLIYKMITEGKPYFLSRPRRFGKSLLVSTLAAVFEGRRELFEAFTTKQGIEQPQLFIAQTDWEWEKYPVLRFDFSANNLSSIGKLDEYIDKTLAYYEKRYALSVGSANTSLRMVDIVCTAHEQTRHKVVVLCDEYDNMMLHSIGDTETQTIVRDRFQDLFAPLKSLDEHLQFVFITGISKFSQMGIFSKLNNLKNISMRDDYATVCGISEEELTTQMRLDIELMAGRNGITYDNMFARLKARYDGYHFSKAMEDVYNPFSLVNAFDSGDVVDYWFDRGTSGALVRMLAQMPAVDITDIEADSYDSSVFDQPFVNFDDPLPILYQSGYLTIKDYDREFNEFHLGIPNQEVREGLAQCLYKHVTASWGSRPEETGLVRAFKVFRRDDDIAPFIDAVKSFFAGVPYQWERDNKNEHYYHALFYTLLTAFGANIRAEEPTAKGLADLTLLMPKGIYVMEIKYDDTVEAALEQIDRKGYAEKYRLDGRPVTKVGIAFSSTERNITDWKAVPDNT